MTDQEKLMAKRAKHNAYMAIYRKTEKHKAYHRAYDNVWNKGEKRKAWLRTYIPKYKKSRGYKKRRKTIDKRSYEKLKLRPSYAEYRTKIAKKDRKVNIVKWRAREKLRYALKKGEVTKANVCLNCLKSPSECHHPDYSQPLIFIELCKNCHEQLHHDPTFIITPTLPMNDRLLNPMK